ncbi:MAG: DUF4861 family protein [Bacteroidales bacterium]|nr:DUF4861 family protein [Bacteroidales bacterium]
MNIKNINTLFIIVCAILGCSDKTIQKTIIIYNDLSIARHSETVEILKTKLEDITQKEFNNILIIDSKSGKVLPSQLIDSDGNETKDMVVFQPEIGADISSKFLITVKKNSKYKPQFELIAYSRFVPERADDYAWENDIVAFRAYGPEAEMLVRKGLSGGTLSSGIDCWLKKVNYPIIDLWYKKESEHTGSYHTDTGEGLDNYHVGNSRGCGGTGILVNDSLFVSGNFTDYTTITTGPVRTSFKLFYDSWNAGGIYVSEIKHITLDAGNNLTRHEIIFDKEVGNVVAGLSLPDSTGEIITDEKAGLFCHWGVHNDSELGIAIVVSPDYLAGYNKYIVNEKDKSHLFVHLHPVNNKVVYYSGFGWKKSGQFQSIKEWTEYLYEFIMKNSKPLYFEIK